MTNWKIPGIKAAPISKLSIFSTYNDGVGITLFSKPTTKNDQILFIVWNPIASSNPPSTKVSIPIKAPSDMIAAM